jgi:hypothetical protein
LLGLIYWVTQEIPFSIPTTLSLQPEAKSRHTSRWSRRLGGRASPRDGFDYHPRNCSLTSAKHPRNIQSPSRSYPVARSDTTHQGANSHSLVTARHAHHSSQNQYTKEKGFIYFSVTCCPQGEPEGNIPFYFKPFHPPLHPFLTPHPQNDDPPRSSTFAQPPPKSGQLTSTSTNDVNAACTMTRVTK